MDENKSNEEPAGVEEKQTVKVHLYCFNCKSDLDTEVQADKQGICPSCGSTNIAQAPQG